jgi:hypothetical protein
MIARTPTHWPFIRSMGAILLCATVGLLHFPVASAATTAPGATAATAPVNLRQLTDEPLFDDLAWRGLNALLAHALDSDHATADQRQAATALLNLRHFPDQVTRLNARQRQQALLDIAAGIDKYLPGATDPRSLVEQAENLVSVGVDLDVNTLEYWGPDVQLQGAVLPVAQTVQRMFGVAHDLSQQKGDALANQITDPQSPAAAQWSAMNALATRAIYDQYMSAYYIVMTTESAATRTKAAYDAIANLKTFDDPALEVQSDLHLRLGKMYLATGDIPQAQAMFDTLTVEPPTLDKPPTLGQRYQAYYFSASAELLASNPDGAQTKLDNLTQWLADQHPPAATKSSAEAVAAILQFRIDAAIATQAKLPADRARANAASVAVLQKLLQSQPSLRPLVLARLVDRVSDNSDLATMDTLLLEAVIQKGQAVTPSDSTAASALTPDQNRIVARALDAARLVIKRPDTDRQTVQDMSLVVGALLEKLGRDAEAIASLLDFVQHDPNAADAERALNEATRLAFVMYRQTPDEPSVQATLDRVYTLSLAAPFHRYEFAYDYGRRLQKDRRFADAIANYDLVPRDDRNWLDAQFLTTVAMKQELDDPTRSLATTQRTALVADVLDHAAAVRESAARTLAAATQPADRQHMQTIVAKVALIGADMAHRQDKDPHKVLDQLVGFESTVQGLDGGEELLKQALSLRVQANIALGNNTEAANQLIDYLKTAGGAQGADMVRGLLILLGDDLDRAQAGGDLTAARKIADDRATLSDFLVNWAVNNPDVKVKEIAYQYSVYDANAHRVAASLLADPAARADALTKAMAMYRQLQNAQNVAAFKATLDPGLSAADASYPDPLVSLGVGLIAFDQGDWKVAQSTLGQLLYDRKLGGPTLIQHDAATGSDIQADNDTYWEAVFKLLQSDITLAKAGDTSTSIAFVANYLQSLEVTWQEKTGGRKWHAQFESLQAQVNKAGAATAPAPPQ